MNVVGRLVRYLRASLFMGAIAAPLGLGQGDTASGKTPVEWVNGLVGTAPLDDQKLIGNAPPPGEQLYSGFTSPAAMLPHSSTELGPINANLDLNFPAGVRAPYFYPNRMIFGFSIGAGNSPTIMPIVGDWTVPPERAGSVYDKLREKSSPGYHSVYLDDFKTTAEMTATTWTGISASPFLRAKEHTFFSISAVVEGR
jgi:putative alpha-1,2-mannosidase